MSSRLPTLGPDGEGWVAAQFVLLAVIAFAGMSNVVEDGSVATWGPIASTVGIVSIVVGGGVVARGILDLRSAMSPFPRPIAGAPLVQSGAYRLIRHPIYSGLVLGAIGWGLVTTSILAIAMAGLLFLLFVAKASLEETWLSAVHPGYRAYKARTKRLIPWIY